MRLFGFVLAIASMAAAGCSQTAVVPKQMGSGNVQGGAQAPAATPRPDAPVVPNADRPPSVAPAPSQSAGEAGSAAPRSSAGDGAGLVPRGGSNAAPMAMPAPATPASAADSCNDCAIPPECQGFPFRGLKYSPGGDALPNKCMPFHATTNNPYAVRCVDAIPGFKTKFAGDEFCILPPPPDQGVQIGLHPQGDSNEYWKQIWAGDFSGYDNPTKDWTLEPGGELTQNYLSRDIADLPARTYYRTYFRMRTGSHHNILTIHNSKNAAGWVPIQGTVTSGILDSSAGELIGVIGGQQRPDESTPITLAEPPEDAGLYLALPAMGSVLFNMHFFNATDRALLREGWCNIWWAEGTREATWYMGLDPLQALTLNIAPGETTDLHYYWPITAEMRLVKMLGHRHFWNTNFSGWIKRKSGEIVPVYRSFDWSDMPTYRYDTLAKNPPIMTESRVDGAASGVVMLQPGDELHFNCHIEFTDERRATDPHAPLPSKVGSLGYRNEVYTGEMCILFGNVTGSVLALPAMSDEALPPFARTR